MCSASPSSLGRTRSAWAHCGGRSEPRGRAKNASRGAHLMGDDHHSWRFGVCLLITKVPASPRPSVRTPCCGARSHFDEPRPPPNPRALVPRARCLDRRPRLRAERQGSPPAHAKNCPRRRGTRARSSRTCTGPAAEPRQYRRRARAAVASVRPPDHAPAKRTRRNRAPNSQHGEKRSGWLVGWRIRHRSSSLGPRHHRSFMLRWGSYRSRGGGAAGSCLPHAGAAPPPTPYATAPHLASQPAMAAPRHSARYRCAVRASVRCC